MSLLVTRLSRGRLRPPVGWASVLGAGTIAGVGFTVSLLVATLAIGGAPLEEAKVGILAAAGGAVALTWLVFRATALLPWPRRIAALLGSDEPLVDLAYGVDPQRDHVRGRLDAPVIVVEYGDFECPYCGRAEPQVRELLRDFADVNYVWRHLPLRGPRARRAGLGTPSRRASSGHGLVSCLPARRRRSEHRDTRPDFQVKGDNPLTEQEVRQRLASRTYMLEDCTSPVVVPGSVDYTDDADAAFERYAAAGMNVVRSTDPIGTWPGFAGRRATTSESPAVSAAQSATTNRTM